MSKGNIVQLDSAPTPCGWRILIAISEPPEKTKGGIILTDETRDVTGFAAQLGEVIAVGEEAYADKDKFKTHWVKKGDWILIGKFAGVRVDVKGKEYRILNDDEVIGITEAPNY